MRKLRIDVGDRVYWLSGEWLVVGRDGVTLTVQPLLGGPCATVNIFRVARAAS